MLNLKLVSIQEKNKLATEHPWLCMIELVMDPVNAPNNILRLVANNEDITYKGNVYTAFNFIFDAVESKSQGELPTVAIRVSNVDRLIQSEMEAVGGAVDATCKVIITSAADLSGEPELESDYIIVSSECNELYATFTLGGANPLLQLFPLIPYVANYCQHVYNTPALQTALSPLGLPCGYEGALTTCTHLLNGTNGCRDHDNVANFGGFPGIDATGFVRAVPQ
jgi:phage-related protein